MSANPQNAHQELSNSKLDDPGESVHGRPGENTGSPFSLPRLSTPSITHAPGHEALQALLAFSSLHEQIRQRRASEHLGAKSNRTDVDDLEQFVLDEVLQLVSERALSITGAHGIAIALADGDAFVCRASAGSIAPEAGARLDPNSGFSGACLRTGGIVRCDDSEIDPRVEVKVCRCLGTRSIVAVPITSSKGTIGLLEAFSTETYSFNDSDVRSLNLLAELILAAMKPEEEDRLAEISTRLVTGGAPPHVPAETENIHSVIFDEKHLPAVKEPAGGTQATETSGVNSAEVSQEESSTTIFQEYGETKKSKSRGGLLMVLLLALVVAMVAARFWRISKHRATVSETPLISAPAVEHPQSGIPAEDSGVSSISNTEAKAPLKPLVTGIWHVSSPDSNTVVIDLQGEVQYEAHRLSDPERIYFDLHGTALAHGLFGKTIEVGDSLLDRVRIAEPRKGVTRVVLETNGPSDFSVSLQSNPYRLVVVIRKANPAGEMAVPDVQRGARDPHEPALPQSALKGMNLPPRDLQSTEPADSNPPRAASLPATAGRAGNKADAQLPAHVAKFRLVLDAGHGGWDLGTIGRKGLMEKDLVLDIVERLGKLLQSRLGAEVIYTRADDTYLPLEKRTEIANLAQADMFVSVHANYSTDSMARGAETYYTNTYSSLRARTSEAGSDPAIAENINLNNVDIREKLQQSHRVAVSVQQALHKALAAQIPGMRNRGVKKASYVVLTGTSMPAILAEVSFVSSPADEEILKSASYRQSIAEGLYKGIAQYAATSHHVNLASASSKPTGL